MLPHYLVTNTNARKQVINDKLQGSVAVYLRCGGGVFSNQIKKGLLLSQCFDAVGWAAGRASGL